MSLLNKEFNRARAPLKYQEQILAVLATGPKTVKELEHILGLKPGTRRFRYGLTNLTRKKLITFVSRLVPTNGKRGPGAFREHVYSLTEEGKKHSNENGECIAAR